MNEIIIKCPKCHTKIPINEQVASRIKEKLEAQNQKDFDKKLEAEREKILAEAEEKAKLGAGAEVKLMKEQLEEKNKRLEEAQEA